jgi:hypothetical protein
MPCRGTGHLEAITHGAAARRPDVGAGSGVVERRRPPREGSCRPSAPAEGRSPAVAASRDQRSQRRLARVERFGEFSSGIRRRGSQQFWKLELGFRPFTSRDTCGGGPIESPPEWRC